MFNATFGAHLGARAARVASVLLLTLGLLMLGLKPAEAQIIGDTPTVYTISRSGSVGSFDYTYSSADNTMGQLSQLCSGYTSEIQVGTTGAYHAPGYYPGGQTIWMQNRVQYATTDGGWRDYRLAGWQKGTPTWNPYFRWWNSAKFAGNVFTVPRGYNWRVVTQFRWVVNNTEIGRVNDVYGWATYKVIGGAYAFSDPSGRGFCSIPRI
jgi:hypothetical protein